MTNDIKKEDVLNVSDLTQEEQEVLWEKWVRDEVNSALDIYLPISKIGHVNVSYSAVILEETEAGPVFSDHLKDAVMLSLIFDFKKPIDITKPIVKDDKPSEESK